MKEYMTAHEYKHYSAGGTGLRSLLDVYLFLRKFGKSLDFDYISQEAEAWGFTEFEGLNRSLALRLFPGEALTEDNH